ncbi:MAG: S8 family serine peptidase [Rhodospirillales bacterium]|nr:MAG: S8 family serine peptidase [Rhodospirillales bacterium]
MTNVLSMPWAPNARSYCAPRRLLFTLALGEDVERIPGRSQLRANGQTPATGTGHGAVDRVLREFGGNIALARLHDPADIDNGFDLTEHARGLSRTYVAAFSDVRRIDHAVDALRQLAVVTSASADYFVTPDEAPSASRGAAGETTYWPWRRIGAESARGMETGDAAVTTAVLDTGASKSHAELRGRLSSGFDAVNFSSADLSTGMSLIGDYNTRDTDPDETDNPHGTACLAIIGGLGRAMPPGLATATSLMAVRVLASARPPATAGRTKVLGLGALSDIDYALKRCVDLGAKVLNCSFGTSENALMPGDPKPHEDTTAYALDRGTVMVAASGNSGRPERFFPAAADGVIAVGSVGRDGAVSSFTTTGDHVALCAPGEQILTPSIDGYDYATGTSFAAPFVAGAAALLVARARRSARPLASAEARDILVGSASPWPGGAPAGAGAGILDMPAALARLDGEIATATTLGIIPEQRATS